MPRREARGRRGRASRVTARCPTSTRSSRPTTSAASSPTSSTPTWRGPIGAAFARFAAGQVGGARKVLVGARHAPVRRRAGRRLRRRRAGQGLDVVDLGLASTDLVYFAAGQARRARRDVHRLAQPGAVQRHQAVPRRAPGPIGEDTGLARDQGAWRPTGVPARRRRRRAARVARPARAPSPTTCGRSSTRRCCARSRSWPTPPTAWAGSSCPAVFDGPAVRPRDPLRRARRHVPEPPGRPDPAREPARPAGPGARGRRRRRAGLRRRRRPGVPRRRARASRCPGSTHHGDRRRRRARQAPRRHDPPQLHLLEGRARGRPRARRHAGAHQGRPQLHQAGDGRDRRRVRRRALRRTTTSATTTGPTPGSSPR